MSNVVVKCLSCSMLATHKFKDCESTVCECNCLSEIRGEVPLKKSEYPKWFRLVTRQDTKQFKKTTKKG